MVNITRADNFVKELTGTYQHIALQLLLGTAVFVLKICFEEAGRKVIVEKPTVTLPLSDGQSTGIR